MPAIKLLVADDHEVVRKGFRAILEAQRDCEVVGEAGDGRRAVEMARELRPDIVVLDVSMPQLNGLEAARQILKSRPQTKILILTMHESDSLIREVLDTGARGYILKSDAGHDLVSAVEALRMNKTFFTSRVTQMILDGYLKSDPRPAESELGARPPDAAAARNRAIAGRRKKQQGDCGGAGPERQNGGNAPRQHHEKTRLPFGKRSRALCYSK